MTLKMLRLQARYNVLTPVALLGLSGVLMFGTAQAQSVDEVNNGIEQDYVIGQGHSLLNNGTITGDTLAAVTDSGDVNWFTNSSSGFILGGAQRGVYFDNDLLGTFLNEGTITSTSDYAVGFDTDVGTFINRRTITGHTDGVQFDNAVTTFTNSGTITGTTGRGVYFSLGVGTFTNDNGGTIRANDGYGVHIGGSVESFVNAGTIEGFSENNAAVFEGAVTSFLNSGRMDSDYGVVFSSTVGSFSNSGTINATQGTAVALLGTVGSFSNTGTINGEDGRGVSVDGTAGPGVTISNAGRISGSAYSVYFDAADGTLKILTGSSLGGKVRYSGTSGDRLDFSTYRGSTIIDVENLPDGNVVAGDNLYLQTTDKVVVVGSAATANSSQQVSSVVTGINGLVTSQLDFEGMDGGDEGGAALGYAPERSGTAAEQATTSALAPAVSTGPVIWGNAAAGGSSNGRDSSLYGALVFGSHTTLSDGLTGGILGGYGRSSARSDNSQTTSDTGVVGLYGRSNLGVVTVDLSVLGGASANSSTRDVSTGGGTEVARASFGGWFIDPTIGLSLPVLSSAEGELAVAGSISYLYGGFGGYTETGSSANLTVGPQTIGVLNIGLGLQGKIVLSANEHGAIMGKAKAELFAESNLGTSSVPISVLGTSIGNAVAPNAVAYGIRGNLGVDMPVSERLTVSAGANGSIRTDGYVSGGANLKLSGTL